MSKGATLKELHELHSLVTKTLTKRISQDLEDDLPTDAATLGVALKLLKDNAVTADPADADDLTELRKKLTEQAQRRQRTGNVIPLAQSDLDELTG